jgi:hypothetical protein
LFVVKKPSLAETHPELAAQADGWDPNTVTFGSGRKLSWICGSGHQWLSAVNNRAKGNGCPVCSGRLANPGFNDLATVNPDLAKQAHGWNPTTVTEYSHQKVAWKCSLNHQWEARVSERSKGNGCPFCSGHRVLAGFNDLATTHPEVAAKADGWDPSTVVAFSNKKAAWKCDVGHRWEAVIGNRAKGSGCPVCSGHSVLAEFNDLLTTHPDLAAEANGWDPAIVNKGSSRRFSWKCSMGHIWEASVGDRSSGKGCPVCSNRTVVIGFNDLATTNPELAAQADGWDATTVVGRSGKKMKWKCESGHSWAATIDNRAKGTGCPVCSNRTVVIGFNDLATTNPELAAQADGWDPTTFVVFSNRKVTWKCSKNHKWLAVIASRSTGSGCPYCSGLFVEQGVSDLATTNPELAAQAFGWDPTTLSAFSNKKVRWECKLQHNWEASVSDRSNGNGCPICSGQKVLAGFNDLKTKNLRLAKQADGWDPTTVTAHTNQRLAWKCELGHTWKATVKNRFRSDGCPICSNKKLLVGFNDLATTNPELASQAVGWDPKTIFANSNKSFAWRCDLGHEWKSTPNNRSGGRGCPSCAEYGFNPSKDGWLYLIENDDRQMFQIGISNFLQNRLDKHSNGGWSLIDVRGPMEGLLTQQLERASLSSLRLRGAVIGKRGAVEKFDGHTEAWTKGSLNVTSIKQILDWVYEDEESLG